MRERNFLSDMTSPSVPTQALLPKQVKTGVEGLDYILNGGLTANRVYLVQGDPGAGKTTLALQFLMEGRQRGEAGLYITLSETESELRAVAVTHGWSLDGIAILEQSAAASDLTMEEHYTLFHPSEVELGEIAKSMLDEVERTQPVRIVLDSLSEIRLLARDPLRYRRQILALKQYFTQRQCTVLLLDDGTAEISDIQLQSLAHGVITLEQYTPSYGSARRRVRVIKMRGVRFRSGYHDFNINTGGLEVYPRLVAADHSLEIEDAVLSSGVPELDELLGGGLDRGTSTLISGPAGVGKSSLATGYVAAAARQGDIAAFFIFDESIKSLLDRSASLGMDLRPFVDENRVLIRQVDPAEMSPGEFAHHVRTSVESQGAKMVVIDSLNGYLNSMPDEHFLIAQMHELLTYLNNLGVITILIMGQHGLVGSTPTSPVDVSYLSDKVILLRFFEYRSQVRQAISVVKKRSGQHEHTIREYRLSPDGIRVGKPLTEFHGVLTGIPTYHGESEPLLQELSGSTNDSR